MDGALFVVAGIAIAWVLWALVVRSRAARPQRSDAERALDEATAKLSARLDALMEPRPDRARVALDVDGFPSIDGTLEVPPRARVFHRGTDVLAGRMLALRQESHPTDGTRIFQLEAPSFQRYTNLLGAPAWSPGSDCVAIAATASGSWWGPARNATPPSPGAVGGRVLAAHLFIEDLRTNESSRHELELELPAGWGADRDLNALLRPPAVRFVDDDTIEVTLCHGPPVVLPRRRRSP